MKSIDTPSSHLSLLYQPLQEISVNCVDLSGIAQHRGRVISVHEVDGAVRYIVDLENGLRIRRSHRDLPGSLAFLEQVAREELSLLMGIICQRVGGVLTDSFQTESMTEVLQNLRESYLFLTSLKGFDGKKVS